MPRTALLVVSAARLRTMASTALTRGRVAAVRAHVNRVGGWVGVTLLLLVIAATVYGLIDLILTA